MLGDAVASNKKYYSPDWSEDIYRMSIQKESEGVSSSSPPASCSVLLDVEHNLRIASTSSTLIICQQTMFQYIGKFETKLRLLVAENIIKLFCFNVERALL